MPLEQLLSLYGYNGSQQADSSLLEARSNVAQMDSNTGSRSRRKRGRLSEVASADVGTTTGSSSHPRAPPTSRHRLGSGGKEDIKAEALLGNDELVLIEDEAQSSQSMSNRTKNVSGPPRAGQVAGVKTDQSNEVEGGARSSDPDRMKGRISDEVIQLSDQDTENSTDIDVVEDDGTAVGLEAELSEEDHSLLHLAQLEEDVVQMGDIEAGLGKGEGLFPPLDLMHKESLETPATRGTEVEYEGGSWADSEAVKEGMAENEQWREDEEGEGAGMNEARGEEEVSEEDGPSAGAMYGDAMLSEATAEDREDSDSGEYCGGSVRSEVIHMMLLVVSTSIIINSEILDFAF